MPRKTFSSRKCGLALCCLATLINFSVVPASNATALLLEQSRSNNQLACIELINHEFELSFIHSVSLTQVFDSYKLHSKAEKLIQSEDQQISLGLLAPQKANLHILQTQERFSAHGQGLPSLVDEPDALAFEHVDGQFLLRLHRPIDNLIVRTDKRFENRLYTGTRVINLNQWPDTGILMTPLNSCSN